MNIEDYTAAFNQSFNKHVVKANIPIVDEAGGFALLCKSDWPRDMGILRSAIGAIALSKITPETFDNPTKYLIESMVRSLLDKNIEAIQMPVECVYLYPENDATREPVAIEMRVTLYRKLSLESNYEPEIK